MNIGLLFDMNDSLQSTQKCITTLPTYIDTDDNTVPSYITHGMTALRSTATSFPGSISVPLIGEKRSPDVVTKSVLF